MYSLQKILISFSVCDFLGFEEVQEQEQYLSLSTMLLDLKHLQDELISLSKRLLPGLLDSLL
jgi:hypothetical protein